FIDYRIILDYMGGDNRKGREAYRGFVIREIGREEESPLAVGKGHGIVGDEKFIERVKERFIRKAGTRREQPAIKELQKACKPEELVEHFTRLSGISREEICRRWKRSVERAMLWNCCIGFVRSRNRRLEDWWGESIIARSARPGRDSRSG
ncbi:MAG: hypothetical protein V1789_01625, partial [PVC group bacterium]